MTEERPESEEKGTHVGRWLSDMTGTVPSSW
jgi:hypothetical protein